MSEVAERAIQAEAYEAILGTPLIADYILPSSSNEEFLNLDVRLYAHDIAVKALTDVTQERELQHFEVDNSSHIQMVHDRLGDDLPLLRRQVVLADELAKASKSFYVEAHDTKGAQVRAKHQHHVISSVVRDLQLLRLPHNRQLSVAEALQVGVIAVGPTGFGKTYVGAKIIEAAGVGRRRNEVSGETCSALVVVPSIDLLKQYTREDNIFRRVIGQDIPIGEYWGRGKDIQPVTVITQRSLQSVIMDEVVDAQRFDMMIFDEAHHATAPRTLEVLRRMTTAMVGLTATPAYNEQRDIRRWFPYIETGSLREFAEQGVLSPVRLLTFQENAECSAEDIAVSLAVQFVREGRQLIVYTQKGGKSAQARAVAQRINAVLKDTVAAAVGYFKGGENEDAIEAYRKGEVRILTTSRMLREGFDAVVDAMISIGPHYSEVDLRQKAGRAMRPGKFEAILAEIWPKNPRRETVTLAALFGIEAFSQGMYIGPGWRADYNTHQNKDLPDACLVPDDIVTSLASTEALRTILVGQGSEQQEIPDDHISLSDLAFLFDSNEKYIQRKLQEEGIHGLGIVAPASNEVQFWYGPNAIEYLEKNPPLKRPSDDYLSPAEIIELTEVSRTFLEALCSKHGFKTTQRLVKGSRAIGYFDKETADEILDEIEKIPFADEDDVPIGALSPAIPATFVTRFCEDREIPMVYKRRNEKHGVKGMVVHLTHDGAAKVRKGFSELNSRGFMPFNEIAEKAGISYATIKVRLTDEELKTVQRLYAPTKPGEKRRKSFHVPHEIGQQIIERLRVGQVPIHVIPITVMQKRLGRGSSSIHNYIGALNKDEHAPLLGKFAGQPGKAHTAYYKWTTLEAIEKRIKPVATALRLDYRRLSEEAIAGSRHNKLYAKVVHAFHLAGTDESEERSLEDFAKAFYCSFSALKQVFYDSQPVEILNRSPSDQNYRRDHITTIASFKHILPALLSFSPPEAGWLSGSMLREALKKHGYADERIGKILTHIAPSSKAVKVACEGGKIELYYSPAAVAFVQRELANGKP